MRGAKEKKKRFNGNKKLGMGAVKRGSTKQFAAESKSFASIVLGSFTVFFFFQFNINSSL